MEYRASNIYTGPVQYGAEANLSHISPTQYKDPLDDMANSMLDRSRPELNPSTIKKTTSSPNVRSLINQEPLSLSAADKKRNKLGYHRTAVACGHCRRRKIRCIPSADTTTTRCQNCIRLKKDCQFFPVDQNTPTATKRVRTDSKGEALNTESETSVSSSSPGLQTGAIDQYDQYRSQMGSPPLAHGTTAYPHIITSSAITAPSQHDYHYSPSYSAGGWQQPGVVSQRQPYFTDGAPESYTPSSFPLSSGSITPSVTSPNSAYSYPPTTQEHQYSQQSSREIGSMVGSSMLPYTMYRANTMPDHTQSMTGRNTHQNTMNLSPQALMPPQFSIDRQQGQYRQPSNVLPRWTDHTPVQPGYATQTGSQAWFGSPGNLSGARVEQESHAPVLSPQQVHSSHFRSSHG